MIGVTVLALMLAVGLAGYKANSDARKYQQTIRHLQREHEFANRQQQTKHEAQQRRQAQELEYLQARLAADQKYQEGLLRLDAGLPDTSDPQRLSAGTLHDWKANTLTIRVHKPAKLSLLLCYAIEGIEDFDLPKPLGTILLLGSPTESEPTMLVLTVRHTESDAPARSLALSGNFRTVQIPLPEKHVLAGGMFHPDVVYSGVHYSRHPVDIPYILASIRKEGPAPSDGLVLWLERAPAGTADE